ncbi:hypothetical protein [Mycobacteroides chelonae]|uniref:hypothetical protein n=1 Tax=Mycobacteroides chelonae TaxID=1774 RepID=UPI0035613792
MISSDKAICAYGPVPVADRRIDKTDRLTPFLIPGSTDLNGPHMIAALSELMCEPNGHGPAYRNDLRRSFHDYYGLPSTTDTNAEFDAALDSAVDMNLILRINPDPEQYGDLFFCNLYTR